MIDVNYLDRLAEEKIRDYYGLIMRDDEPDRLLCEEDALAASLHGDQIYRDNTRWSTEQCCNRALDIAFRVQSELRSCALQ